MERRIELKKLIEYFLSNGETLKLADTKIERYFSSFTILLKVEGPLKIKLFLNAYLKILQNRKIPFFRMNTLIALFQRWKKYPEIIEDLHFLSARIKKSLSGDDFWHHVVLRSNLNRDDRSSHEARLTLLACAINLGVLKEDDLVDYSSIIDVILLMPVHFDDVKLLKTDLRDQPEHPYHSMFIHILRMKENGVGPLEIGEMMRNHYSMIDNSPRNTENYRVMIERLYDVLPSQYMAILKRQDLKRLLFLHQNNPAIFSEIKPISLEQLSGPEIVKGLFGEFIVSGVFIRNFCNDRMNENELSWFAHILKGHSLVTAANLPVKLTKKGAHNFRCFGEWDIEVTKGVVLAALLTHVEDIIYSKRVVESFQNHGESNFWIDTMSKLHRKGLETHEVREVMDYIGYRVFVEGLHLELKHKKLANLRMDVENWHRQLRTEQEMRSFNNRKLPDYGISDTRIELGEKQYEIKQLKKTLDLYYEGKDLKHCVYSYRYQCFRSYCYIFSLREKDESGDENRLITLEVVGKKIVQAKGKFNRKPTEEEKKVILLWAREKDLGYAA